MTGPVHVGVTVEQAWQRVPGGSAAYLLALLDALRVRDDVRATGLAAAHRHDAPEELRVPVPVRSLHLPRYALYRAWNRLSVPRPEWADRSLEVVHASTWAIPPTSRPLVVTVHDVAFLRDASHFTPRGVRFFTRALERTRDEAAAVVVPSQATAEDCVAAGIGPERLHVVPHGAPGWSVTAADVAEARTRLGLPDRFVLWCGTFEPRKNVSGLLAAFARLAERDPEIRLVLVGPPGWGELPARPAPGPWERRVVELGRLSAADLRATYAAATAFCFPSTWEGFGLPVLEAMSVGTPVVTSRGTSMAEVVGDAGVLVDPLDPEALSAGLERALSDEGPLLGAAARERSAAFRWSDAAAAHAAVYRGLAGRG
ncbi:glycosyltransferase family 4 protein [Cellulosimicrobium cellulans]|uniref:glycosyltransferase family 4 protein n=1 Tax=Cellulosimicrobium cellulans TaxID=1710 RepID=UPI00130D5BCD|nr:glycosyltransferase family 1 protein [Cellulosimicrobium cellulans]